MSRGMRQFIVFFPCYRRATACYRSAAVLPLCYCCAAAVLPNRSFLLPGRTGVLPIRSARATGMP